MPQHLTEQELRELVEIALDEHLPVGVAHLVDCTRCRRELARLVMREPKVLELVEGSGHTNSDYQPTHRGELD